MRARTVAENEDVERLFQLDMNLVANPRKENAPRQSGVHDIHGVMYLHVPGSS